VIPVAAAFDGLHLGEFLPPVLITAAYLLLFAKRASTLAREGRPVATWREVSFVSGALMLAVVQVPPFDTLGDQVLIAHMIQHIIIGDIASLLVVFGLTGPVLQPLLHIRATRPLRVLASPVVALVLWTVDMYVWHPRSCTSWPSDTIWFTPASTRASSGSGRCCGSASSVHYRSQRGSPAGDGFYTSSA
jgi:hypothetical protein